MHTSSLKDTPARHRVDRSGERSRLKTSWLLGLQSVRSKGRCAVEFVHGKATSATLSRISLHPNFPLCSRTAGKESSYLSSNLKSLHEPFMRYSARDCGSQGGI